MSLWLMVYVLEVPMNLHLRLKNIWDPNIFDFKILEDFGGTNILSSKGLSPQFWIKK